MKQTTPRSDTGWQRHSRRGELIKLVLEFVRSVAGTPGIRQIALIGSLTTPKETPKDADLLVTIEDGLDLTHLARHGRRLQGQAQSIGHGADIFLLSQAGEYLGRICHWKECRPGIRLSCDALHCGAREFLHDDLEDVRLTGSVTEAPPLDLWPHLQVRGVIAPDVLSGLVEPLAPSKGKGNELNVEQS
jgi:hypothetical protein